MTTHAYSRPAVPMPHRRQHTLAWLRFVNDRFLWLPLGAALALVWANVAAESYFRTAHALAFPVNEIGMALFLGLIYLYTTLGRTNYVMVTALAMIFSIMTSYTRARAESLITKCKVGFMERPERIVLFMIGAFTNRMAAVLWVILVLSVFTVADRIIHTYRELRDQRREVLA